MKRALVWDPYLDTLGGGERYALTVAEILAAKGYQVVVPWNDEKILEAARDRFGLKLSGIEIDGAAFELLRQKSGKQERRNLLSRYAVIFWVSDGSVPTLYGKTNLLHYQVPFKKINGNLLTNWWKLGKVKTIVVNSRFTEKVIRHTLHTRKTTVLYPPVSLFSAGKKQKLILNVGRFVSPSHPKRQDVLIEAFKTLLRQYPDAAKGWKLILAGGHQGDNAYLEELKAQAEGLPVEFLLNPSFDKIKQLYAQASIYWHGAGYGIDETQHPEKVEHFGITTVEAMSASCVPVVIDKGGQREIVTSKTGYLVKTVEEIVGITGKLITDNRLRQLGDAAIARAKDFSRENFAQTFERLL